MTIDLSWWVGKDQHGGLPSLERPDARKSRWTWEAIFAHELPYDPVISPDRSLVAYTLARESSDIWMTPVAGGSPTRLTTNRPPMASWEDTPAAWSPDGTRIAYASDGWIWVLPIDGGPARRLAEAYGPIWLDDARLVVGIEVDETDRIAVMTVDDPWPALVSPAGQNTSGWSVGQDGSILYVNYPRDDLLASEIWRIPLDSVPEKLTGEPGFLDHGPEMSPDGASIAFVSERSGWNEVHLLDLTKRSERQLTADLSDFYGLHWHSNGEKLAASRLRRGRADLVTIDPIGGSVTVVAEGGGWSSSGWAGDSIVALHEDHTTPPRLVRVDPDGSRTPLTGPPPVEVASAPHATLEEVTYPSFDGLEIHGFLYRPKAGAAPVVVYAHGGPTEAYGDFWDPHAQYFVDKGYGWLSINFRGSYSYGIDFERANFGKWGVDDTKDCLAAHDYLAGLDWVDPRRIAIFGPSYGSYLALCALAFDPEHRFACGVAKYGDSEIATSWATGDRAGREAMERMMKTPAQAPEDYRAGSPIWSADNIEKPILVAHGEQDQRVPAVQSSQLVKELKRLGKRFEYVTYPTEAHGLLRPGPHLHFYSRLERFLDWHLM